MQSAHVPGKRGIKVMPHPRAMRAEREEDEDVYASAADSEWVDAAAVFGSVAHEPAGRLVDEGDGGFDGDEDNGGFEGAVRDKRRRETWWYVEPHEMRESGALGDGDMDFERHRLEPPGAEADAHLPKSLRPIVQAAQAQVEGGGDEEEARPSGAGAGGGSSLRKLRTFPFGYMPDDQEEESAMTWNASMLHGTGDGLPAAGQMDISAAISAHPWGVYLTTMASALDVDVMMLLNEEVATKWSQLADTTLDETGDGKRMQLEQRMTALETRLARKLGQIRGNAVAFGQMKKRSEVMAEARRIVDAYDEAVNPWLDMREHVLKPWLDDYYNLYLSLRGGRGQNYVVNLDATQLAVLVRPFLEAAANWTIEPLDDAMEILGQANPDALEKEQATHMIVAMACKVWLNTDPQAQGVQREATGPFATAADSKPLSTAEMYVRSNDGQGWMPPDKKQNKGAASLAADQLPRFSMAYIVNAFLPPDKKNATVTDRVWLQELKDFISAVSRLARNPGTSGMDQRMTDVLDLRRTIQREIDAKGLRLSDLNEKAEKFITQHRLWTRERTVQRGFGLAVVFPSAEARIETSEGAEEFRKVADEIPTTTNRGTHLGARYPQVTNLRAWLAGVQRVREQFVDAMTDDVQKLDAMQRAMAQTRLELRAARLQHAQRRRVMQGFTLPDVLPLSSQVLGNTIRALTDLCTHISGFERVEPGNLASDYTQAVLRDARTAVPLANLAASYKPKNHKRGARGYTPKNTHNISIYDGCAAIRALSQFYMGGLNIYSA